MVQVMSWRLVRAKLLSEPMIRLPTHICVTRPQIVNNHTYRQTDALVPCLHLLRSLWVIYITNSRKFYLILANEWHEHGYVVRTHRWKNTKMIYNQTLNFFNLSISKIYKIIKQHNGACKSGHHYWDYNPGAISMSEVIVTNLKIRHPYISSLCMLTFHWDCTYYYLMGILQNMVNPSLAPTQPEGRNCPLSVLGVKVSLACSNNTVYSPHGYIFPIRWSNQLNQSERLIYAPLAWITTDLGNGLVSSLCQAIAWTNFD